MLLNEYRLEDVETTRNFGIVYIRGPSLTQHIRRTDLTSSLTWCITAQRC